MRIIAMIGTEYVADHYAASSCFFLGNAGFLRGEPLLPITGQGSPTGSMPLKRKSRDASILISECSAPLLSPAFALPAFDILDQAKVHAS